MGGPLDSKDWLSAAIDARLDGHDPAVVRGRLPRELRDADPEGPDVEARARMLVARSLRHRLLDRQSMDDETSVGTVDGHLVMLLDLAALLEVPFEPGGPPRRARHHPGRRHRRRRRRPDGRAQEGRRPLRRRGAAHPGPGGAAAAPGALPARGPRRTASRSTPAPSPSSAGCWRAWPSTTSRPASSSPTTPSPTWSRPATRSCCSSRRLPASPRPTRSPLAPTGGWSPGRWSASGSTGSGSRPRAPPPPRRASRRRSSPTRPRGSATSWSSSSSSPPWGCRPGPRPAPSTWRASPAPPTSRPTGWPPCRWTPPPSTPTTRPGSGPSASRRRRGGASSPTSGTSSASAWWTRSPRW